MKLSLIPVQLLLLILWYAVPAMATVPAWLIFLPMIILAILTVIIVGVLAVTIK